MVRSKGENPALCKHGPLKQPWCSISFGRGYGTIVEHAPLGPRNARIRASLTGRAGSCLPPNIKASSLALQQLCKCLAHHPPLPHPYNRVFLTRDYPSPWRLYGDLILTLLWWLAISTFLSLYWQKFDTCFPLTFQHERKCTKPWWQPLISSPQHHSLLLLSSNKPRRSPDAEILWHCRFWMIFPSSPSLRPPSTLLAVLGAWLTSAILSCSCKDQCGAHPHSTPLTLKPCVGTNPTELDLPLT